MAEEKTDQVKEEVKTDQSSEEQSEDTEKEPLTLAKVAELAQGLQKGYTLTRQDISEMRDNLAAIAEKANKQTGAQPNEEDYVTVGKLREVLTQYDNDKAQAQAKLEEANRKEANRIVSEGIAELYNDGIISSKAEEDSLINYAIKNQIVDLNKAAVKWMKDGEKTKLAEAAKTRAKQEEGSKVGTSSKTSEGEQGVSYRKIKEGGWWNF